MKLYNIITKQNLPIDIDTAWKFISNPNNLRVITPEDMGFVVLSASNDSIYSGQIIEYIVKPVLGIPIKWITEITHVMDKHYFVDEQRFGPYTLWHHKHFIKEIEGGVEMTDIVDYILPLGIIGRLAHFLFVKSQLNTIFEYRNKKLIEIFGEFK